MCKFANFLFDTLGNGNVEYQIDNTIRIISMNKRNGYASYEYLNAMTVMGLISSGPRYENIKSAVDNCVATDNWTFGFIRNDNPTYQHFMHSSLAFLN